MPKLTTEIVRLRASRYNQKMGKFAKNIVKYQKKLLSNLINKNKYTEFGQDHFFKKIKTIEDFKKAVPIRDYEGHRSYIDKVILGHKKVLTKEKIFMFNLTSGTTSKSKLIPVTNSMDRLNAGIMRQWLAAIATDYPGSFSGSFLGIVSPEVEGWAGKIPYGSASGRIYRRVPWVMRHRYAVPYDVYEIKDYDQKYFSILRFALERNVTLLVTPNPSTILRLNKVVAQNSNDLVKAIFDGNLGIQNITAEPEIIQSLSKMVKPNINRARELEFLINQNKCLSLADVWPNLSVLGCWLGGSVGSLTPELRSIFNKNISIRDIGFLASEGRFTLPLRDGTSSGLLTLHINFFEFIPEDLIPEEGSPTLLAHQLEVGKRYYIIFTNAGGLYRYDINDIIEVTSMNFGYPEVAFVRKGRDMTNITGEKLHVNHCLMIFENLKALIYPVKIVQFKVWPDIKKSRYIIAVEVFYSENQTKIDEYWQKILITLDQNLCEINLEYANKRQSNRLNLPCLWLMSYGWFESEQAHAINSGKRDAQFKWSNLSDEENTRDKKYLLQKIEVIH